MDQLEIHYKTLGLSISATPLEIKEAYRRLIKTWHPDKFPRDIAKIRIAEEKVKAINHAYSILKNNAAHPNGSGDVGNRTRRKQAEANGTTFSITRDPAVHYQQAVEYVGQENYTAAAESLSVAIRIDPSYAKAYRYRGFIYSVLGYELRAESDLRKAAELDLVSSRQPQKNSQRPCSRPGTTQSNVRYHANAAGYSSEGGVKATAPASQSTDDRNLDSWPSYKLDGHNDAITSLTSIRTTLASSSLDGQIHLWNLKTKKLFCTLSSGHSPINAIQFSADGQFLVSGCEDGMTYLWHIPTSSLLRTFSENFGSVRSLLINQPQGIVVTGTETGIIAIWNLRNGQLIQKLASSFVSMESIQYSAKHNKLIAACSDGLIRTWDMARTFEFKRFAIQEGAIHATVMTPDSDRLILAGEGGTITTWSILLEDIGSTFESNQGSIATLAMGATHSMFASGGENASVRLWNLADGSLNSDLTEHQSAVAASLFVGDQLVTGSLDKTIRLWSKSKIVSEVVPNSCTLSGS